MVRPDFEKWDQSAEEMRRLAIEADHPRSRERYQARKGNSGGVTSPPSPII